MVVSEVVVSEDERCVRNVRSSRSDNLLMIAKNRQESRLDRRSGFHYFCRHATERQRPSLPSIIYGMT